MGSDIESLPLVVGMVFPFTTFENADSSPASGQLSRVPSCSPLPVGSTWPWPMRLLGPHDYGWSMGQCGSWSQ